MVEPHDEKRVSDQDSVIGLAGYYPQSGAEITIEAYDFAVDEFVPVTTVRSSGEDSRSFRFFGADWYKWSGPVVLEPDFWSGEGLFQGLHARIRAATSRSHLVSVREDWSTCFANIISRNGTAHDFQDECAAERSPVAYVLTEDACLNLWPEDAGFVGDMEFSFDGGGTSLILSAEVTGAIAELTGRIARPGWEAGRTATCAPRPTSAEAVTATCEFEFESACDLRTWLREEDQFGLWAAITMIPDDPRNCGFSTFTERDIFVIEEEQVPDC